MVGGRCRIKNERARVRDGDSDSSGKEPLGRNAIFETLKEKATARMALAAALPAHSKRRRAGCNSRPSAFWFRLLVGSCDLSFGGDDFLDVETQSPGYAGSVSGIGLVEVLDLKLLDALRN